MEIEILKTVLLWGFGLAVILGAVANKTNFCTMGAVSDWVNMGHTGRIRAWVWAMAVAIGGAALLEFMEIIDLSLTTSNDTSNPPYRTPSLVWPRYIVGGLIFGVGMTLGSGCGNKTLIRVGGGNIKSIFVLAMIAAGAYLMMFTNFDNTVFLQWMNPISPDLSLYNISGQDLGSVIAGATGSADAAQIRMLLAALIVIVAAIWVFKSTDFRGDWNNIIGGSVVGLVVVGAWYITAGPMGTELLEEAEMAEEIPFAIGAQSFTFVAPSGHLVHWGLSGFPASLFTFALAAGAGVIVGSLAWSLVSRGFRFEWFVDFKDAANHIIGGLLMGIGGVLSMGCTIGQAVSGASTLAIGSFLTFISIVIGCAVTMKVSYYRMLHEDAGFLDAFITALVDVKLLPSGMRKLEDF
ncbi:MAG: YeeE/YedE family protein [Gammaproteobacteria bacterium]